MLYIATIDDFTTLIHKVCTFVMDWFPGLDFLSSNGRTLYEAYLLDGECRSRSISVCEIRLFFDICLDCNGGSIIEPWSNNDIYYWFTKFVS